MSDETEQTQAKRNGADLLIESLLEEGVEVVFGYPGGAVLPIYDALYRANRKFKHILCRHEQGLVHAAEGYARVTGRAGVVIATSGPGGTNLITGIADAMIDSLPLVVFTGQVSDAFIGSDAFQEADIIGITTPITKHNYQVKDVKDLPRIISEAFHIATTGRKGPVVIDLPKNISEALVGSESYSKEFTLPGYQPTYDPNPLQIKRLLSAIANAKQPVVLAGAGVQFADASQELLSFVERYQMPVVSTLLGLGSFPSPHQQFLGMGGMHGSYASNMAVYECDLLINIGARFDDRFTGNLSKFAPNAQVVHIDIDAAEIGKNVATQIPIVGDAKAALRQLLEAETVATDFQAWNEKVQGYKQENPFWYQHREEAVSPQWLIEEVYKKTNGEAIVVTDVGQHQMWAGQFYQFKQPHHFVSSGGLGTMGFGLPAAIGAQAGQSHKQVVALLGDGGIQMSIQELATIKDYNLPIKIIIVNNQTLGMVRQWQELLYEERYSESLLTEGRNPDFIKLAEAYGIKGYLIESEAQLSDQLETILSSEGPALIDVRVAHKEKVYPMVTAGSGNHEMIGVKPL